MTSPKKDGGIKFTWINPIDPPMTMRQAYKLAAMHGLLARKDYFFITRDAAELADEMIAEDQEFEKNSGAGECE